MPDRNLSVRLSTNTLLLLLACSLGLGLLGCRSTHKLRSHTQLVEVETRQVDTLAPIPGDTASTALSLRLLQSLLEETPVDSSVELLSRGRLRVQLQPVYALQSKHPNNPHPNNPANSVVSTGLPGRQPVGLRLTGICEPDSLRIYQTWSRRVQRDSSHQVVQRKPQSRWLWAVGGLAAGILFHPLGRAVLHRAFRRRFPFA